MRSSELFKNIVYRICEWFEMILAAAVVIGLILATIHQFWNLSFLGGLITGETTFTAFLEAVFGLIIGIEFLQMLCRPNSDNVIEVLIFLVARHLILQYTNTITDFLAIIAVCMLCVVRRFLHNDKVKNEQKT